MLNLNTNSFKISPDRINLNRLKAGATTISYKNVNNFKFGPIKPIGPKFNIGTSGPYAYIAQFPPTGPLFNNKFIPDLGSNKNLFTYV